MVMLRLAEDVSVTVIDPHSASIKFEILNPILVVKFLRDDAMMSFLTDPPSKGGCNLKFMTNRTTLIISRKLNEQPFMQLVCNDFLETLKTYIFPVSDDCLSEGYDDWYEIATNLSCGKLSPLVIKLKQLERGDALLARDIPVSDCSPACGK